MVKARLAGRDVIDQGVYDQTSCIHKRCRISLLEKVTLPDAEKAEQCQKRCRVTITNRLFGNPSINLIQAPVQ